MSFLLMHNKLIVTEQQFSCFQARGVHAAQFMVHHLRKWFVASHSLIIAEVTGCTLSQSIVRGKHDVVMVDSPASLHILSVMHNSG